jgi:hypothetical protein
MSKLVYDDKLGLTRQRRVDVKLPYNVAAIAAFSPREDFETLGYLFFRLLLSARILAGVGELVIGPLLNCRISGITKMQSSSLAKARRQPRDTSARSPQKLGPFRVRPKPGGPADNSLLRGLFKNLVQLCRKPFVNGGDLVLRHIAESQASDELVIRQAPRH